MKNWARWKTYFRTSNCSKVAAWAKIAERLILLLLPVSLAGLALVTWKFATFPSSAACNIRCSFNGTTNMFCVNATQAHVCMLSLFLFYVYSLSVLWCLSMVKTIASLYLAFYLCFMIWLTFFPLCNIVLFACDYFKSAVVKINEGTFTHLNGSSCQNKIC